MFYPRVRNYTEAEENKIAEFKDYCRNKGLKIPEREEEILRFLQSQKFVVETSYNAILKKNTSKNEKLPLKVTQTVFNLLNEGFIYLAGRDRNYRPIIVM